MITANCNACGVALIWQECPTGGWWYHALHPTDEHDAQAGWEPYEYMTDQGEWVTGRSIIGKE